MLLKRQTHFTVYMVINSGGLKSCLYGTRKGIYLMMEFTRVCTEIFQGQGFKYVLFVSSHLM